MSERKYSISELDRMRRALRWLKPYRSEETTPLLIEDRLRTYMLNGTDPEELEQAASVIEEEWKEKRRKAREEAALPLNKQING